MAACWNCRVENERANIHMFCNTLKVTMPSKHIVQQKLASTVWREARNGGAHQKDLQI